MVIIRRAGERGHAEHGWLDSRHTFSFADYYDARHMGFRALRVINEDRVAPGQGFGRHSHRDMEIVTYVLDGALEHEDSIGTGSIIRPGDVQRMSAGTGVAHSEFNASPDEPVHFLQIWLLPRERGLPPGYEQRSFSPGERQGKLRVVASPDGRDGSVTVHSDATLYGTLLAGGQVVELPLAPGRHAWVHVARGQARVAGQTLGAGDAAALSQEAAVKLEGLGAADQPAEILVFDLG
jgi:redox-sensitive bicupin YhaK (pirin superfamily)